MTQEGDWGGLGAQGGQGQVLPELTGSACSVKMVALPLLS